METRTQPRGKERNVAVFYDLLGFQEAPKSAKLRVQEIRVGRRLVEGRPLVAGLPGLCPLHVTPEGQVRQLRKNPHCEVSEALLR